MKKSATFLIDDVFNIEGRGIIVTGLVMDGEISIGMQGRLGNLQTRVLGIEAFNKNLTEDKEGQSCGLLLEGITKKEDITKGQIISFE